MNAGSYNLARRYTAQNEPDMIQEDMVSPPSTPNSRKSCFDLISKVCPAHPLPVECERYDDVTMELRRRNSDRSNHAIAFQGMSGPEVAYYSAARKNGSMSNAHAQLQRRMTSPSNKW
ncbi:hypothetical protein ACA910_009454 [Epithemia clementina (nom. ined.)]